MAAYLGEIDGIAPVVVAPAKTGFVEDARQLKFVEFYVPSASGPTFGLEILPLLSRLKVIQSTTAGVEHLLDHVPPGVRLCSARGCVDHAVAEWVVSVVLGWARDMPRAMDAQRARQWSPFPVRSIRDATVLIVGYGSIGRSVARRLVPFGTTIRAVARTARGRVAGPEALHELVPEADVVVLALPLTGVTRELVNGSFLALMKDGSLLVNPARGGLVDVGALVSELRSGRLSAALDVIDPEPLPSDSPLWGLPNAVITPHSAAFTRCASTRTLEFVAKQVQRFASGEELQNVVEGQY